MTKKELIEMLSPLPDNAVIRITKEYHDLLGDNIYALDIQGYYECNGYYVLTKHSVRPYKKESND